MADLPLDTMTVEEKLRTMELLWSDLCERAGSIVSPPWHGRTVAERENSIIRGEDAFEDWDNAKQRIRKETE